MGCIFDVGDDVFKIASVNSIQEPFQHDGNHLWLIIIVKKIHPNLYCSNECVIKIRVFFKAKFFFSNESVSYKNCMDVR